MKKKVEVIVLSLLVLTAVVVWLGAWKVRSAVDDPPITVLTNLPAFAVDNPQVRWDELKRAEEAEYKSSGRNPFSAIAATTPQPIKGTGATAARNIFVPQGPRWIQPPPPKTTADWPANLKFFGYGAVPKGSPRRAFIRDTENETIYVVPEGQTLLGRYRIVRVGNTDLEFQEIFSGLPGRTNLEEAAAPPNA